MSLAEEHSAVPNFLWFLIIGIIAGWVAGRITKGKGFGLFGNLIVGVLGALVGGFLFDLVGLSAYGVLGSLITATVGAIVLLLLLGFVKK
ncbi:MAG: GlsB/YeaQ/YmgE family stress response membrane protein [Gemmatimonadota bacterium]|nr:GlsB/YeaQ/YmgE family stress response membrane protein [Gemmatimonadota bacterium]